MNILPKKRWHVRTKENIARVRRDEALAAEEEKKKQLRIEIAEREARAEALRKKAREQYGVIREDPEPASAVTSEPEEESGFSSKKHVNLFYELERDEIVSNETNKEYEKEKKLEREKYEKQIGYLTYLGQDTNELTGQVSWFNKLREKIPSDKTEISQRQKAFEDPLAEIRKYLGCEGVKKIAESVKEEKKNSQKKEISYPESGRSGKERKKHKKSKKSIRKKKKKRKRKHSSESEESTEEEASKKPKIDVERLRAERLKREMEERRRAHELFAKLNGVKVKKDSPPSEGVLQKYNSQFNPHLAKQNYL